ncbi:hypothetical protein [Halalkalibacter alkalisediminis]|nr:hypothetical protein [Halalkalibacter alkalisediminis]
MSMVSYASFLKCPYQYADRSFSCWKEAVQNTINDIVKAFLKTPYAVRTHFGTLKLISDHWSQVDRSLFDSYQHFILTSAKVTDHLLQVLMSVKNEQEPIFEMEISSLMSIPSDSGFIEEEGFIFEKILIEVDEKELSTYWDIFKLYCSSNCDVPPKQIEVVDLLNAKRYVHFP